MAFTERSRVVERLGQQSTDRTTELVAGVLLAAVIATLGLRGILPIEALAPAIATLVFTLGAVTAGLALLCRRHQARRLWFDVAGILTLIGVAVSILIEPDQMVRLVTLPDPTRLTGSRFAI
jgi:hypothetical protein